MIANSNKLAKLIPWSNDEKQSLPHIDELFSQHMLVTTVPSNPSFQHPRSSTPRTAHIYQPKLSLSSSENYCPECFQLVRAGVPCQHCFYGNPTEYTRLMSNIRTFHSPSVEESHTGRRHSAPFRTPIRKDCPYIPPRRQIKAKAQKEKDENKANHKNKEKWRRDKHSVFTGALKNMHEVVLWPGKICTPPCSFDCAPSKELLESILAPRRGFKDDKVTAIRTTKDEASKCAILGVAALREFSFVLHFASGSVFSVIKIQEEEVEKLMASKEEKAKRVGGERDIMAEEAYDLLNYMLEQCKLHGIELECANIIAERQKSRKIRMGMDVTDEERETPGNGSSRAYSEYEEEEGDVYEEGVGNRYRRMASEESS